MVRLLICQELSLPFSQGIDERLPYSIQREWDNEFSLNTSWRLPSAAVICKTPTLYNQHISSFHITVASTSINPVTLKMEAVSSSKLSKHLTTTHRRPSLEYLFSSDGVINHYAANDIICSVMHSPILIRESQDQIVLSELYHQLLCSQAATSGFCILLYILQLCCIRILI